MYCIKCGKKISEESKFCRFCGSKLKVEDIIQADQEKEDVYLVASGNRRFFNGVLDWFFGYFFAFITSLFIVAVLAFFAYDTSSLESESYFIYLVSIFLFYIFFEYNWGKTPGKFITRTKVVNSEGERPTLTQVIMRTLCRFIPFEVFSFLGSRPVGLHDKIAGTVVIEDF